MSRDAKLVGSGKRELIADWVLTKCVSEAQPLGGWVWLRRYQRSTAFTSASMSAVVRARTIAPSAPASRQRAQVSRGALTQGLSAIRLVAQPVALETDDDPLVGPKPAALLE